MNIEHLLAFIGWTLQSAHEASLSNESNLDTQWDVVAYLGTFDAHLFLLYVSHLPDQCQEFPKTKCSHRDYA